MENLLESGSQLYQGEGDIARIDARFKEWKYLLSPSLLDLLLYVSFFLIGFPSLFREGIPSACYPQQTGINQQVFLGLLDGGRQTEESIDRLQIEILG